MEVAYLRTEIEDLLQSWSISQDDQQLEDDLLHICECVLQHGKKLESQHKETVSSFCSLLTKMCEDSSRDLHVRFKLLEVLESRSLGWLSQSDLNPTASSKGNVAADTDHPHVSNTVVREPISPLKSKHSRSNRVKMAINGQSLVLQSSSGDLLEKAEKVLTSHYCRVMVDHDQEKHRGIQYSKENLLALHGSAVHSSLNLADVVPSFLERVKHEDVLY